MRRQPGAHLAPLACLLLVLAPGRGAAQPAQDCSRTSSLVGRIIQLQGAPGNLTVLDDCSFEVHLYRSDWVLQRYQHNCNWWASSTSESSGDDARHDDSRDIALYSSGYDGSRKNEVELPAGLQWSSIQHLYFRCPGEVLSRSWADVASQPAAASDEAFARPGVPGKSESAQRRRRSLLAGPLQIPVGQYPGQDTSPSPVQTPPQQRQQPQQQSPPPPQQPQQPVPLFPSQPAAPGSAPTTPVATPSPPPMENVPRSSGSSPGSFSALDSGASPSVTVVNSSPNLPSLGGYPGGGGTDLTYPVEASPPVAPAAAPISAPGLAPAQAPAASVSAPGPAAAAVPALAPAGLPAGAAAVPSLAPTAGVPASAPAAPVRQGPALAPVPASATATAVQQPPAQAPAKPPAAALAPTAAAAVASGPQSGGAAPAAQPSVGPALGSGPAPAAAPVLAAGLGPVQAPGPANGAFSTAVPSGAPAPAVPAGSNGTVPAALALGPSTLFPGQGQGANGIAPAAAAPSQNASAPASAAAGGALAPSAPALAPGPAGGAVASFSLPSAGAPAPSAAPSRRAPPPAAHVTYGTYPTAAAPQEAQIAGFPGDTGTAAPGPQAAAPLASSPATSTAAVPAPSAAALPASVPAPGPAQQAAAFGAGQPALAPAPAGPAVAPKPAGPSAAPVAAPGPSLSAAAPQGAQAPGPMQALQAPVPGPSAQPLIDLALRLTGPGLANLSSGGNAILQQTLAQQLHLSPDQIVIKGSRVLGPVPNGRRRSLQQEGQPDQTANVNVQIRPSAAQNGGVMTALQDPGFSDSLKAALNKAGLPVSSATVASVQSNAPPPPPATSSPGTPVAAAPAGAASMSFLHRLNGVLIKVHGWCMFAAFIVLFPLGVVTAHGFKNFTPWWFHVHRIVQCTGWAAALAGLAVGLVLIIDQHIESIHRWIGVSVVAAISLQALGALLLRPAPGSKLRKVWNLWHWWVGRLVLAAGIGQFFFGLWIVGNPALYYIVPAAIIALWCIVAFVKELVDYLWAPAPAMADVKVVQDFQNGGHMRSAFQTQPSDNGRKLSAFYAGSPAALHGAGLHTRPSYMGELPPPLSAGSGKGQEGVELQAREGPAGQVPRPPLHPLPSRPSFSDRLPTRPSELLKEGKLGAGEQIMARRRTRRLVPEGVPLSARNSGTFPGASAPPPPAQAGGPGSSDPAARRAETFRPRPRPSQVPPSPGAAGNGAVSLSPKSQTSSEEVFYPAKSAASELSSYHSVESALPPNGNRSAGSDEIEAPGIPLSAFAQPGAPADEARLPPAVQDRIKSYYKE